MVSEKTLDYIMAGGVIGFGIGMVYGAYQGISVSAEPWYAALFDLSNPFRPEGRAYLAGMFGGAAGGATIGAVVAGVENLCSKMKSYYQTKIRSP